MVRDYEVELEALEAELKGLIQQRTELDDTIHKLEVKIRMFRTVIHGDQLGPYADMKMIPAIKSFLREKGNAPAFPRDITDGLTEGDFMWRCKNPRSSVSTILQANSVFKRTEGGWVLADV